MPRKLAGAVIHDEAAIMARITQLMRDGTVTTHGGSVLPMPAASILLHGDTPGAVTLARTVRATVEQGGARVTPLSRHRATLSAHN